ncbi:MAG: ribonuclease P protein component [candidate division NC10 bacterium]|nr:ribonuclease P protein component [candidate division NC10 bacterium]
MAWRGSDRVAEIKRTGRRVQGGPWVMMVSPRPGGEGRLTAALGRGAGPAVTRSRARRIARHCYALWRARLAGMDVLLMARGDLSQIARRKIRGDLLHLFQRLGPAESTNG